MKRLLMIVALALLAVGCEHDGWDVEKDGYQRTTLVYLASDSNLSGGRPDYAAQKIEAIAAGYRFDKKRPVLIYNDPSDAPPALWEITSQGQFTLVESYSEENSASGEVLNRVILRAAELRPARDYGLVVFSHGKGWLPQGAFEDPAGYVVARSVRTITIDGRNEMDVEEFAAAIPDGMFDFIVLEACHTAGIEMLWPLRDKAEVIFGSSAEILVCGFTPVYHHSFDLLARGRIEEFARATWVQMRDDYDNYFDSGTLSLVRTAGLEPLADFIGTHCGPDRMVDVAYLQRFGRNEGTRQRAHNLFFDFEQYYGALLDSDAQRAELRRLTASVVPWKQATAGFFWGRTGYDGFLIERHSGLTSYAPQAIYPGVNSAWMASQWGRAIH